SFAERNATVAAVASRIFATDIPPTNVVTETLVRATDRHETAETVAPRLAAAIRAPLAGNASDAEVASHPLSVWVETTLGVTRDPDGKWVRAKPRTLEDAVRALAQASGLSPNDCQAALTQHLLLLATAENARTERDDGNSNPFVAFKLHQFLSGAGTVFVTLEPRGSRRVELEPQPFLPGEPGVRLFDTHFCRSCGHEYHPARYRSHADTPLFLPRSIDDAPVRAEDTEEDTTEDSEHEVLGFLTLDASSSDSEFRFRGEDANYPEEWQEEARDGSIRLKANYRRHKAQAVRVRPDGTIGSDGLPAWFTPGKFR